MIRLKALSTLIFLSATVATPVLAQEVGVQSQTVRTHHGRVHALQKYRGLYNQLNGPTARTLDDRNIGNFGFSGRERSRVGGEDADLNPSGN
jgi:hypothetical protein